MAAEAAPVRTAQHEVEDVVLRALQRVTRGLDLYSKQLVKKTALTAPQLLCLHAVSRFGEVTPGRLTRELSISGATVSGVLDRLELRGLVARTRDARDRRKVLIRLTPAGADHLSRAPSPLPPQLVAGLAGLSEPDRRLVARVLTEVADMIGDTPE